MENMLQHSPSHSFRTDCKELIAVIKEPHEWPSFATELEKTETLQICFPEFKIIHVPRLELKSQSRFDASLTVDVIIQ
ncbi:hypothetical protein Bca4012_028523 [Brassica carinata]